MISEKRKLKVLFGVPEKSARGGINACEPPFIEAIRTSGIDAVTEVYLFDNREDTSLMTRILQVTSTATRFKKLSAAEKYDIIHLNTSFELRSLLRDSYTLFRLSSQKVFLKFHGSNLGLLSSANPFIRMLLQFVIRRASGVGVLSDEERDAFASAGFDESKVFVVKNAVTNAMFPRVSNSGGGPARLLFVSRLVQTKGLEDSIRALKILIDEGRDVVMDVLGSGEAKEPAERLAEELSITARVRFHGHVDEESVSRFYASSDILVFPTFHDEGFPMVIFGSLGFGIPIVTTKIRAAADYLKDGHNCIFCNAHDPQSVAQGVARILQDRSLAEEMRAQNQELARAFVPEKLASEYLDIYHRLVK